MSTGHEEHAPLAELVLGQGWLLWLALALPLLWLVSRLRQRRRAVLVPTLMLWAQVASSGATQQRRRIDWLLLMLLGLGLGAILLAAQPQLVRTDDASAPPVFVDPTVSLLHMRGVLKSGDDQEWQRVFERAGLPSDFKHGVRSASPLRAEQVLGWRATQADREALVISARQLGKLPPGVQQWSPGADPEALPFTQLAVDGRWLYGRSTRSDARFRLVPAKGESEEIIAAIGTELMHQLPPLDSTRTEREQDIRLLRVNARDEPESPAIFLRARLPISLALGGASATDDALRAGLQAAFGESFHLPGAGEANAPDLWLGMAASDAPEGKAAWRIQAAKAQALPAGTSELPDFSANPLGRLLERWSQQRASAGTPLTSVALVSAPGSSLVSYRLDDGGVLGTASIDEESRTLYLPESWLRDMADDGWLVLLLRAACQQLLGRDPMTEARYDVRGEPTGELLDASITSDGLPPWLAAPLPFGRFTDSVVNPLATPADQLHAGALEVDWSAFAPRLSVQQLGHWLMWLMIAFAAGIAWLLVCERRGRTTDP